MKDDDRRSAVPECSMSDGDRLKTLERCLDDSARQIENLNAFATSGDQRAVAIGGVYISAATAIVGGLIAWAAQKGEVPQQALMPGMVAAFMFYLGGAMCLWLAFPTPTYVAGSPPEFWRHLLKHGYAYEECLQEQLEEYERKITANKADKELSANLFRTAAVIGLLAPLAAGLIYFSAV